MSFCVASMHPDSVRARKAAITGKRRMLFRQFRNANLGYSAAVLGPAVVRVIGAERFFFAVRDRGDAAAIEPEGHVILPDRGRALLTEAEIVFRCPPLIAMAFHK